MTLVNEVISDVLGTFADTQDVKQLQEGLANVATMFAAEDRGWTSLTGTAQDCQGISLDELKRISEEAREMAVGNTLIGRAIRLRTTYVFSKGVVVPGYNDRPASEPPKKGRPKNGAKFFRNPVNIDTLFSTSAHERQEKAASTDGMYLVLGDDKDKTVRAIPISEIGEWISNPDFNDEIWMYKRVWTTMGPDGRPEQRSVWYYTDRFPGKRQKSIPAAPNGVRDDSVVDVTKTIIDQRFNTQVGWPLGIPDAAAGLPWAKIYSEMLNHGKVMTQALARFAMKVVNERNANKSGVGAALSKPGTGQVASLAPGQDLVPLNTAGRTYDFNGIRPLASQVATAFEVSVVHLLSDPGAAGSSYGSASNLDLPTKRAMVTRQNLWAEFFQRVVLWATGDLVDVRFPALDDQEPYREMQTLTLAWNSGNLHADEYREAVMELLGIDPLHAKSPTGVMLPNNEKSLARKDVDADAEKPLTNAPSPDQGVSNGGGGVDSTLNNDIL